MSALDGAIPFVEVECITFIVGENLNFDVTGFNDVFFEIDAWVAEGGIGLSLSGGKSGAQAHIVVDDAHTATAATCDGLYNDGIADVIGELEGFGFILHNTFGAGDDFDAGFFCESAGFDFVAEESHRFR